jgi:hypothetical protein
MSYDGDYAYDDGDDYAEVHENCVPANEVVSHVFQNNWAEVEYAVDSARGDEWLRQSKPCLDLVSKVSEIDRARSASILKKKLQQSQGEEEEEVSDELLLTIATEICRFLENTPASDPRQSFSLQDNDINRIFEPTPTRLLISSAQTCGVGDDLSWARDLLLLCRAFTDFLSLLSDGDVQGPALRARLREPIQILNSYRCQSPAPILVCWEGADRDVRFSECQNPELPNLCSFIAGWISGYLKSYFPQVGLGVCAECGRLFERERRDKTFCSKTCQNRVAYKRKKIFESEALATTSVTPETACDITPGLWMHHPRFGIGLVESVADGNATMDSLSSDRVISADIKVRYKAARSRRTRVTVRFLHGLRILGYSDLFEDQKREDQLPTFYRVNSRADLERLL